MAIAINSALTFPPPRTVLYDTVSSLIHVFTGSP